MNIKRLAAILLICLTLFNIPKPIFADINSISNNYSTLAYKKEWRYKSINGKLYKRLWNTATQQWETKWMIV